jgi:hypothetical protein
MKSGLLALVGAMACGLAACGGGGGGPVAHAIANDQPTSTPAGTQILIGPFSLPSGAVVDYTIADTPTGIGSDTMDVGVAVDATVDSASPTVYGGQMNVSTTSGSSGALPAGTYDLLINCNNLIDDCIFDVTVIATY